MKRAMLILFCLLPLSFLFSAGQPETPAAETADSAEVDKSSPLSLYNAGGYKESADLFLQNPGRGQKRTANYYNAARAWHQDYLDNENIESLEKAVEGYYRVLDYDPAHSEALVNLELARRELEKNMEQSSQGQGSESQDSGQDAGQGDQSEKDAGQGDQSEKDAGQGDQGDGQDQSQSDRLNDLADKQEQLADA
ncbi:MAG: hypothetical protein PQJ50_18165, partial [Spirochaetales bacterium]|nr:hypothetical protein [Spirochaetales bacterium]